MMRADLGKIRPLIEASTTETPEEFFGQKFIPICRIICLLYAHRWPTRIGMPVKGKNYTNCGIIPSIKIH
jgi:hypothetical protein